jgi:hypothetical protein
MPFLPASTRFFFRLLWIVLLCTFAVVLVLAAMPLTSVVSVVIDSESSPASRWLSLNILIASAWLFHNAFDTYQRIACSSGESG